MLFIFEVCCVYLWLVFWSSWLCLFFTPGMILFGVIFVYVICCFGIHNSGSNIPSRKMEWSRKVRIHKFHINCDCWESTTLYILYYEIASWLKVQSHLYFLSFSHPWWKSTIIDNFTIIWRLTPKIFLTITNVCIPVGLTHKC